MAPDVPVHYEGSNCILATVGSSRQGGFVVSPDFFIAIISVPLKRSFVTMLWSIMAEAQQ